MAFSSTITLGTVGTNVTHVSLVQCTGEGTGCQAITGADYSSVSVSSFPVTVTTLLDTTTHIKVTAASPGSPSNQCTTLQNIAITGIPAPTATPTPTPTPTPTATPTPTPTPTAAATSNTFTNTNGPAKLYPQPNLLNPSPTWQISLDSGATNNTVSLNPTPVNYANTPWASGGGTTGDYAEINMGTDGTTTSTTSNFRITFQILDSPSDGMQIIADTLQITDGTTDYPGTGTLIQFGGSNSKYQIDFAIGMEKGRTFRWGTVTDTTPGNIQIGNGN